MSIADLRTEYKRASLSESDVHPDPIQQFAKWFGEAMSAEVPEANAMSVSTVGSNGRPSSRILLIKEFDHRGFVWFTNYDSRKGQELNENQYAALLFHWIPLERQVRIEGRVERIADADSDRYFQSRPLGSRIGALASAQSRPVASREELEAQYAQIEQQYGEHPPRPAHWGGYRLVPDYIEFWQGRPSRLHDRIAYRLQADGSWQRQRLQP
jgi:pyridoxamine 5'-phosphate oxidase